jgi:hypothetical protein
VAIAGASISGPTNISTITPVSPPVTINPNDQLQIEVNIQGSAGSASGLVVTLMGEV